MRLRGSSWVFASWADASDRHRPDGSRTRGYVITLATEKLFGEWSRRRCQRDDLAILQTSEENCGIKRMVRLELLRLLTNPSVWSGWLCLGCTVLLGERWHLDETVRQVGGMLITDSRGLFDALTRNESPQLRLRSSRTSEEARGIKEQCAVSYARIHWVNTSTMLADNLTKTGYPARAVMESSLVKKRWRCTFDPTFESGRRRKARGAPLCNQEDSDKMNPSTDL